MLDTELPNLGRFGMEDDNFELGEELGGGSQGGLDAD